MLSLLADIEPIMMMRVAMGVYGVPGFFCAFRTCSSKSFSNRGLMDWNRDLDSSSTSLSSMGTSFSFFLLNGSVKENGREELLLSRLLPSVCDSCLSLGLVSGVTIRLMMPVPGCDAYPESLGSLDSLELSHFAVSWLSGMSVCGSAGLTCSIV